MEIREATDATLDAGNLMESMLKLDSMYYRAGFNEEAKFGFLRVATMKIPQVATFAMYPGVSLYDKLKKAIQEYDSGIRSLYSVTGQKDLMNSKLMNEPIQEDQKLLVRPDYRVKNMEDKIDTLANQMADLTLLMKKSQARSSRKQDADIICSYCKKLGHGANKCPDNPHRNVSCPVCGKIGQGEEICWSKNRSEIKKEEKKDENQK